MDEEQKQKLIQAAQHQLRLQGFTDKQEQELVAIHEIYENWKGPETEDVFEKIVEALIDFKKTANLLVKLDEKSTVAPMFDREAVKKAIESLHPALEMEEKHRAIIHKIAAEYGTTCRSIHPPKRGKPYNQRLQQHLYMMHEWFEESFGSPGYGTNSIFTRLVHHCLAVMDPKFHDNPPCKAIKEVVIRGRYKKDMLKMHEKVP